MKTYILLTALTCSLCASCATGADKTNAAPQVISIVSKPKFKTNSVGSVARRGGGLEMPYEMTWLVLKDGDSTIRVLWSTTTKRAPISLNPDEQYVFEIKTTVVNKTKLYYIHKVKKDKKVLLEHWMP